MLYLDNAASTKLNDEVLEIMISSLMAYGNSEAKYYAPAEQAKKYISEARSKVADFIGAKASEIIFTSGATESNNLLLKGLSCASQKKHKKIIISSIEHSSIYDTCMYLKTLGIEVVEVPVNREGRIDLDVFESLCDENTILVSIIYVNNEIGSIQDLQSIDKICFKYHIPLHTDATQAAGKVKIDVSKFSSLQFLTFTAHKIYGPKGIGCLYNRENDLGKKMSLIPLMHGGEQEDGFRAGTMATPLIVGFGKACEIAKRDFDKNQILLEKYENIVLNKLRGKFGVKLILNNAFADRIPGLLNIRLVGYNNMVLLNAISSEIAASTGSACAIAHPSRILKNIGLTDVEISESIRISISAYEDENNFKALDLL